MPIEQHVLPRDHHVIEDDERIDLVEAVGERIILDRSAAGKAGAADELQVRRTEVANKADRIVGKFRITPIGDRRFRERLVGVAAAVSNLAPRTTIPASVSLTTCRSISGSCSCGRFERSPLGSVLAET
jgi:hypothetical protein